MADQHPMPIAIVGMSCRLPGDVSTPGEFYRMLCRKRSGWSEIPPDRFNPRAYHHPNPDKKGCFNSGGGYFIKGDISMFDAAFFDITKKEAESMDPAQRLLLECAYEALENAGVPKEVVSGKKVGVFVGGNYNEHRVGNLRDLDHIPTFDATGNQGAFLAGRLAYYFNLRGPTFTVDTACSSSMHALHLAVQSIRAGESEQAIVGASHLITQPDIWVSMGKLRLFSDAGKTYAFDHRAKSGYARGEGAGCLILKPLTQAQADNDHIFSVITHTGINHNGRTVGIVAPSPEEQESLLRQVFNEAGINPCDVGFFEAHGTGTKKGDPIEASAIYKAVGSHFTRNDPLHIGSTKPNIGHLECASGVVSIIKSVLMLYYGFILPNADFERVNEAIPLDKWNMRVATWQRPWPAKRKYVCVNNFGFSGSNSTCILRAAPQIRGLEVASSVSYSPLRLFVLSANDETALRNSIKKIGIWIEQHAELYQTTMPRNLAYTLCQRRSHLPWRVAVVAGMCSDVASALNSHEAVPARAPSDPPRLAFVYTGQGAQWFAMGRELLKTHPIFFEAISRADAALRQIGANLSVLEELRRDKASTKVGLAHISQPVCSAIQLALTDLFASFGIKPAAVTGHSSGEIGAAYAAGALTFESAMAAAYYRGQVIIELKEKYPDLRGSMMAAGAGAEETAPLLDEFFGQGGPRAVVACENSPSSITLSGDEEAVDRLCTVFQDKGVFNRKLFVDVAYHSPHMKLIAESYLDRVRHVQAPDGMASSSVEFFSSLRGRKISLSELGPQYWVDNLTQAVRFSTSVQRLCTEHCPDILVEIGPHAALKGPIMQSLKRLGSAATKISYLPTLVRGEDATRTCLETAGLLFVRGYPLNFFEINHHREEDEKPELVPTLYTYPWSRQKYWYESRLTRQHRLKPFPRNDLLGILADWSSELEPTWRNIIRTEDLPWLKEYLVQSRMVFPVAGFVSMIIEAATQSSSVDWIDTERLEIKNLRVSEHLFLVDGQEFEILLSFRPLKTTEDRCHEFRICSYEASRGWLEHCTGKVAATANWKPTYPALPDGTAVGAMAEDEGTGMISEGSSSSNDTASDLTSPSTKAPSSAASDSGNGLSTPDTLEWSNQFSERTKSKSLADSRTAVYECLESQGMSYPVSFQSLLSATSKGAEVTGQAAVRETATHMPLDHETPYKIHPSIIDAMFQIPLLGPGYNGDGKSEAAFLPSSIRHINVHADWKQETGDGFAVIATPELRTASFMVELSSASSDSTASAVSMAGVEYKALESPPCVAAEPRQLCFKVNWEPLTKAEQVEGKIKDAAKARSGIVVVTESEEGARDPLVAALCREIEEHVGVSPHVCSLLAIDEWASFFVVLSELDKPIMSLMTEDYLEQVKRILTVAPGLIWLTKGATHAATEPLMNLALGMIRTARSETNAVAATLDLSPHSKLRAAERAALVREAFVLSVLTDNENAEMEFAEVGGKLVVPRIAPDEHLNLDVHRSLGPSAPYMQNFHQEGRQLRVGSRVDTTSLDDIYFEDAPDAPLGDDEVEIKVAASAISQDDITANRVDKPSTPIARSCSGTVTRVGCNVSDVWEGAKACALAEGSFGTHARARASSVAVVWKSLSMAAAACIPGPILAAYYALVTTARVQAGERVLIQLPGPAGVAAVEVVRHLGAISYALVESQPQREAAQKAGVPAERILDAGSIYLRQELDEVTQGEGMEVVLALSGCETARVWECLANFGRFVEIRTPGPHQRTRAELGVNATYSSINMVNIAAARPVAMQKTLTDLVKKIEDGLITPPTPPTVVPVTELSRGIQMVRDGAVESVIATASDKDDVKALHKVPRSIFQSDGTHLIFGGTGGLGRSMTKFLIEHGARTIVLLSRSGGGKETVQQLQRDMHRHGARVLVMTCDVSEETQVWRLFEDLQGALPPICGVIHAAMVLRDNLIENMSFEDYRKVLKPKVTGAWNLHACTVAQRIPLQYFVMLSSASGILGSRGQGSYAAGNTFLDSLVQYRARMGLPGTALDLTAVTGAGYLAENVERQEDIVRNFGNETVSEEEVLALLSAAVRGVCGPQCLTGLKLHLGSDGQWPYYANDARFVNLKAESLAAAEKEGLMPKQAMCAGNAFRAAKSDQEAANIAAQGVVHKLSEVLTIAVEDLDVARNITSYGLDSLTAIELRNWIAKELRANLQILELLSSGTINDLAELIVQKTRTP